MNKFATHPSMVERLIHIVTWTYIFLTPFFFSHPHEDIVWERAIGRSIFSLGLFVSFYINYFWLIPAYFLEKHHRRFVLINVACLFLMSTIFEVALNTHIFGIFADQHRTHNCQSNIIAVPEVREGVLGFGFRIAYFFRNLLSFTFAIGASMATRLAVWWHQVDRIRQTRDLERTEAELVNLKTHTSPHFLLNTLNNIYALTAFDTTQAQSAILSLAKMLRYQLYEEQGDRVSLEKEAEFILSYVALMQLRQTDHVEVVVDIHPQDFKGLSITPHVFISLVENAFKHGVSPMRKSFIHIRLSNRDGEITFSCVNSNYPKPEAPHEKGGIGLALVASRLQLCYPDAHSWEYGVRKNGTEYYSTIVVKADPICASSHTNASLL